MMAQCPICRSPVEVDDSKIGGDGLKVTCPLCDEVFLVKPPSAQAPPPSSGTRSVATPSHGHTSSNAASGGTAAASASRRLLEEDSGDGAAPRVLVAHDSFSFGETVKTLLEEEGFDVEVVHDGDAAMDVINSRTPAVAILEAALPKRFGFQICADVRSRAEALPVKLLLVASIYDRKRMGRSPAVASAPDEFLEPRNLELELVPKVKRLLRGREGTGSRPAAPAGTRSMDVSRAEVAPRAPEVLPPAPAAKRKESTHPTHPTMGEEDFADLFEESATGSRASAKAAAETELPARESPPIDDVEAFLAADGGNGKSPKEPEPAPVTVTPARGKAAPKTPLRIGDEPSLDHDSEEREIWAKVLAEEEDEKKPKDDDELLRTLMAMADGDSGGDDEESGASDELEASDSEPAPRQSSTELEDGDLGLEFGAEAEEKPREKPVSELDEILDAVSTSRPAVEAPKPKKRDDDIVRVDDFLSSELPSEDYGAAAEGPTDRASAESSGRIPSAGPLDIPSRGPVPETWKPDADERRAAQSDDDDDALNAILGEDAPARAALEDDDSLVEEDEDEKEDVVSADDLEISQRDTRLADAAAGLGGVMPGMPTDTPTVLKKGSKAREEDPLERITEDFDEDEERSPSSPPPVVMEGDDAPPSQSSFGTEVLDDEKSLAEVRVKKGSDGDSELDDLLESSLGGGPEAEAGDTKVAGSNGNGNAARKQNGEGSKNREEHDKAKRLAKLIVGDILLYNAEKIPEAVKSGTFFEVMKGDIKDGREFYDEKVPDDVRSERDYIQELLQETLDRKKKELGLT